MDEFIDYVTRGVVVLLLAAVILAALWGIGWLVRPWLERLGLRKAALRLRVRPLDVLNSEEDQKQKPSESLARQLAGHLRRIHRALVPGPAGSGNGAAQVPFSDVNLIVEVGESYHVGVGPLSLDLSGIGHFLAGLGYRGYVLQGSAILRAGGGEVLLALEPRGESDGRAGAWAFPSTVGLGDALREAAYELSFEICNAANPHYQALGIAGFKAVVQALEAYREAARTERVTLPAPGDPPSLAALKTNTAVAPHLTLQLMESFLARTYQRLGMGTQAAAHRTNALAFHPRDGLL